MFKGPQIQNYSLKCCFLAWRRASENVDSYPKMGQNIFGSVSGACAARGDCLFEFFIAQAECENYYEFNFSPSTLWAAYAFDCYRIRSEWTINEAPRISVSQNLDHYQLDAIINLADLPLVNKQDSWLIGLTAVLETQQNKYSYWALKHPETQPNFHHRNGFIPFPTLA